MSMKATLRAEASRDYGAVASGLKPGPDREATMQAVVDTLWEAFGATKRGVSWLGFYTKPAGEDAMVLGPRRDKPACSPLGLHGICGQSYTAGRPIVVQDSAALNTGNYIACDPNDRSEVVIPLFDADGSVWGVLDVDSYDVGAFDQQDVVGLRRIVERVGLSTPQNPPAATMHL
jgi:putative methionine-R-sulfoxide reductase with GAF domain